MKITLEVKSICIIRGYGPDRISIETVNLPYGMWPYEGYASLDLSVAAGSGEDYCARNFPGVPVKVISMEKN